MSCQGIVFLNKNGNFCKGTYILKIIARAKVDRRALLLQKFTSFCRMSVTAGLLRLGALLRDNLQMGAVSIGLHRSVKYIIDLLPRA